MRIWHLRSEYRRSYAHKLKDSSEEQTILQEQVERRLLNVDHSCLIHSHTQKYCCLLWYLCRDQITQRETRVLTTIFVLYPSGLTNYVGLKYHLAALTRGFCEDLFTSLVKNNQQMYREVSQIEISCSHPLHLFAIQNQIRAWTE